MTTRPKRLAATGYIDAVSEDGWVRGWAWYPDAPSRIVQLDFLADGTPAGSARADMLRDDLRQNGIGDGAHAFAFALPDSIVLRGTKTAIVARDAATGEAVGAPVTFERRLTADAQARIEELEAKARLLDSALASLAARQAQDAHASSALFATVGRFFTHLAESAAAGAPEEASATLRSAIEDVQARFEPLELDFAGTPSVTVCVGCADATLAAIYGTIQAIQQTTRGVRLEVVVMDDGSNPHTCLLPLVITNLRYLRAVGASGPVALLSQAARAARGRVFVHLAAGLAPTNTWLRDILTRFSTDPKIAAIAAKISEPDGILCAAGASAPGIDSRNLNGFGFEAASDQFANPIHVAAPTTDAFALRLETWNRLDNPPTFTESLENTLHDICTQFRRSGNHIIYDPHFTAIWTTGILARTHDKLQ